MADEPLMNFTPVEEMGQPAEPQKDEGSPRFKGWGVFVVLVLVVIASFWISFQLGKRLLIPVKKTSEQKIQAAIPEPPPSILALQRAMSMEVTSKEVAVENKNMIVPKKKEAFVPKEAPKVYSAGTRGYYKVQAGLYVAKEKSQNLADQVAAAGFKIYLKKVSTGWRVQVGAFRHKSEAEALKQSLIGKGFKAQIVYE